MTDNAPVGPKLKALREEAGLSIRQMADALGMPGASSYNHYETRYKKSFLPIDLIVKITSILNEHGVDPKKVQELGSFPNEASHTHSGFGESKSPRIDVSVLLDDPEPPANAADDPANTIKLAVVGDKLQIAATVDAEGFDELIRRLNLARQMID